VLVVSVGLPVLALVAARTRAGRVVAAVAAVPATLVALVLIPYGFGVWQIPAVACLWVAVGV
jgi:putative intracellular protease/amidase